MKVFHVEFFKGNIALFTRQSVHCVVKDKKIFKLEIVTPSICERAVKNEKISNVIATVFGSMSSELMPKISVTCIQT